MIIEGLYMKKTILPLLILSAIFVSCASTKTADTAYSYDDDDYYEDDLEDIDYSSIIDIPVSTDDYMGDFDPIQLEPVMILKKSGKKLSPKELRNFYLVPRSNSVELTFRDTANEVCIIFSKAERDKILDTCQTFLNQYDEKTLPHHKINSKTAYFNSKCGLWYGVLNSSTSCSANDYYLNCEFIDKRPYLLFHFTPTRCDKVDAYTPKVNFYMSPSQIRDFMEIIKQENLEALLTEKRERAYTY